MEWKDWDEADFTDENSRLRAYVQGHSAIWVPPEVKLDKWPDTNGLDCVLFLVPPEWMERLPVPGNPFILVTDDGDNVLEKVGWRRKENTEGVLNDFVKLADATDEEILAFAKKWGPLWLCVKHRDCIWSPNSVRVKWNGKEDCCLWVPAEPLHLYRRYARMARAILNAAYCLVEGKPVPTSLWVEAGWSGEESQFDVALQRFFLASSVNGWLSNSDVTLWLNWGSEVRPRLSVDTGWGCFQKIWLELAQCLTGARQLCVCDMCNRLYVRYGRKPQAGRKNYCPDCREQNAKQRAWAKNNNRRHQNDSG